MTTSKAVEVSASKPRVTLTQKYQKLSETLDRVEGDRQLLEESLSNAVRMLRQEDIGWALPEDGTTYKGLSLEELKGWSGQIRASLTGTSQHAPNPHMRNGLMLRHSFIWNGGIHYDGIPENKQGRTSVQKLIDAPDNKRLIFGSTARRQREHALYSDGFFLLVGNDKTKKLRPVALSEITAWQGSDLYADDIIAYRWTRHELNQDRTAREAKSYWVFVDWYDGKIPSYVRFGSQDEPVLKDHTAFDLHANRPDGHPLGSPDAVSALVWARVIRDLIMNGVKMQDALAMFAFKVTAPTKAGQQASALELAKPTAAGSVATMGGDNNMTALSTAGSGYDFGSIGFVVSTMAASLHVSGIALAANTALAGSSYGAAKTLDLPGQMAMETRRAEHIEFDERVLRWMGAGDDLTIYFDTYEDATDEYRAVQAAMLAWTTGTLTPEGFRAELELIYGRKLTGGIPKGVIIPNNQKQIDDAAAAQVAAADAAAKATAAKAPAKQAASADQGKSKGTGSADHTTDAKPQSK